MKKLTIGVAAAAAAAMFSGAASAEEFSCTTTVGAESLDNVFVPDGRTCTLNGARLNGNIVVGTGATLTASAVRVNGNIQASGHRAIFLNQGTIVGGSVQIKQGGSAAINTITVNADLQIESNSRRITVANSDIGSNLQVFQNAGGVVLRNNDIAQNMQCKENAPAPTGAGNVAGNKEDQCAAL